MRACGTFTLYSAPRHNQRAALDAASSFSLHSRRRWRCASEAERYMRHFKVLGWLWLLFGLFWSLLVALVLIAPAPTLQTVIIETNTRWMWWQDRILDTLECTFFLASTLLGVGLLRRWRRAEVGIAILGGIMLALYVLLVSSSSFPPQTLFQSMFHLSPMAVLGLYSLAAVSLIKYEPKTR